MKPSYQFSNQQKAALGNISKVSDPLAVPRQLRQPRRPFKLTPLNPSLPTKEDLLSRLYGKGVPHIPMPSVKRTFDTQNNSSQRPLSAKLKFKRGVSISPMRKRLQELNVTVLQEENIEDDQNYMDEESRITAGAPEMMMRPMADLNVSEIKPNPEEELMRAQYKKMRMQRETIFSTGKSSITGLSIMSSLKPKMNTSIDKSSIYSMKTSNIQKKMKAEKGKGVNASAIVDPMRMDYSKVMTQKEDVEEEREEAELSPQEHLEKVWSRKLMDKLRGRISTKGKTMAGIEENKEMYQSENVSQKKLPEHLIKLPTQQEPSAATQKPQAEQESEEEQWADLDKFLEALLEDSELATTKFMYLNAKPDSDNPYDLDIVKYKLRNVVRYFTISGKGVTMYKQDKAIEFIPLSEWLIERDLYVHIKNILFFKFFKKWKLLNVWRKGVQTVKRNKITENLSERLFYLDPIYRRNILKHKKFMWDMSKLRLMDIPKQGDAIDIREFANRQKKKRQEVYNAIDGFSVECRKNFNEIIQESLDKLKERILIEKSIDEEQGNTGQVRAKKPANEKTVFEALGFPENLGYGHRAALRRECCRFLRLSYLIDFLTIKSLGDIYLDTVREVLAILEHLNEEAKQEINVAHDILRKAGTEPILMISLKFNHQLVIPKSHIKEKQSKEFSEKYSLPEDFDLNCHVDILPEESENEAEPISRMPKKYLTIDIPEIVKIWLELIPGRDEFIDLINKSFSEGLISLEHFERWSRHNDLTRYATALEDWDECVGGDWEEPENNYLTPRPYISEQEIYRVQENVLKRIISSAYEKGSEFISSFSPFLLVYYKNMIADYNLLIHPRVDRPVETMLNALKLLEYQKKLFLEKIPETCNYGLLKIDCSSTRKILMPSPVTALKKIEEITTVALKQRVKEARDWITDSRNQLQIKVETVEDYVQQKKSWNKIADEYQNMKDKVDIYGNIYNILTEMQLQVKKEDKAKHTESIQEMMQLNTILSNVSDQQELNLEKFKKKLSEQLIPQLTQELEQLKKDIEDERLLTKQEEISEVLKKIEALEERYKKCDEESEKYKGYRVTLNTAAEQNEFAIIDTIKDGLSLRSDLWKSLKEWSNLTQAWIEQQFATINAKEIGNKADNFAKIAYRVDRELPENPVSKELKTMVDTFKKAMPIVSALRNEHLEKSHWKTIKELLKADFEINDPSFKLKSLLDLHAVDFQEEIQQISVQASQEALLRSQYNQLEEQSKKIELVVKPVEGKGYVLDELEPLYNVLDESLANINTILGSRYIKPLLTQAENLRNSLLLQQAFLDEWSTCQRQWLHLENIFSGQDIKKQLVNEAGKFEGVDKFFKATMLRADKNRSIRRFVTPIKDKEDIVEKTRHNNKILDDIEKSLEDYLETKRKAFPRFYFLSSDELLLMLANQKPEFVQPNLRKCFDNIIKLDIHENLDIVAMISSEGERVDFNRPSKAKEGLETWLESVQKNMRDTLFKLMNTGLKEYETIERKEWVLKHFGQIVSTIAQIMWCSYTEASIQEVNSNSNALIEWYEENVAQIQQLTELVNTKLDPIKRKIIVALVTNDVHARDIIEGLVMANVNHLNDFNWQKQLRFYWDEEKAEQQSFAGSCYAKQVSAKLEYGYEYGGASSRLVITPLTDRCWITITGALHIHLGASPAGPAGTGKTESTKDLAKNLGMYCVVFNCSEQINCTMLGKLFCGVVQQGAWTCMDEFNRINIEVLSVVARQIMDIRMALMRGDSLFNFEEKEISLNASCGIFITMNPSYAGRTELPDNLKVHFRPVAMMIPDYELIAEIMLFSEGFAHAKNMSKKMVKLYKLSSEQLSQQDHYDFGMRALKSVLVTAGALKRAEPGLNEEVVLLRAMRDSNVPKFVKADLPLFHALITDLFPNLEVQPVNYGLLQLQIEQCIEKKGLIKVPSFIQKILQLFEVLAIRFGATIVGPTGAGKTASYEILRDAMTELRAQNVADDRFQKVNVEFLNPKAITLGELFGEVNPNTQDWHDGLASKLIRKAAADESKDKTWIIFDGPIDSLWIENMNTVLDDTMTLCLSNGQRIKLRSEMKMLFEVQDLAAASPATVSRLGVVYLPGDTVGWRPFVQMWLQKKFKNESFLSFELIDHILYLFDSSLDRGIAKVRTPGMLEPIKTVDIQIATNICNLLEVFIIPAHVTGENNEKKKILSTIFCWSYIWGAGGALDEISREKFDFLVRNIFDGMDIIQGSLQCFDYYMDTKKNMMFRSWQEITPGFIYDKTQSFYQIMVPTIETVRQGYLLEKLISKEKPVFFTGVTGSGKSVMVKYVLNNLNVHKNIIPIYMTFSAQTSALKTQLSIEDKLQKKRRDLYGAEVGKTIAIFIDDVNMPTIETYGAQPPLELLRLLLDKKGFFDRDKLFWKNIEETTMVCAAGPPGGGRNEVSLRFSRRFNTFCIPQPNKTIMQNIFKAILTEYFKAGAYSDAIQGATQDLVNGTIEIYYIICEQLKPTPAKFHYMFNMRDVSKVFQSIMMARPQSVAGIESLAKLWIHEVCRVFSDRLINQADKEWLAKIIVQYSSKFLKTTWEYEELFEKSRIIWGDILKLDSPIKFYEEIREMAKLRKMLENQLEDYNIKQKNKMQLVFFDDAVEHILRISRVLRQPRGYIMLIGVGGSGKTVLTRLSAFMQKHEVKEMEARKDVGGEAFKNFLKDILIAAGVTGTPLCFLIADTQISSESMLEDINSLLNNGEIPNLFNSDELGKIINDLRPVVAELKMDESRNAIYSLFLDRIRTNLHISLCMSPAGDSLRQKCRKFPSLINCCTLNWFSRWPNSALLSVSTKFLSDLEGAQPQTRKALSEMCMDIHTLVEEKAAEMYIALKRNVYVTPKSYLDLISLYIEGLKQKRKELNDNFSRLNGGLDKLNETAKRIAQMKIKLEELQPKLKEKSEMLDISQKRAAEEQRIVADKERILAVQNQEFNEKAKAAKAIADDAEADLNVLKPELDAAMNEVKMLDKKSIYEIKSFPTPPDLVLSVMESVMLLLGEKLEWNNIKIVLGDSNDFVNRLTTFGGKVSQVPENIIKRLRQKYVSSPEFKPEIVATKAFAAKTIVKWVLAMNNLYDVMKKVEPKRKRYEEEKVKLDAANEALTEKTKEVNEVKAKAAKLKAECDALHAEKNKITDEMALTKRRLTKAEELIGLLGDEGVRWKKTAADIQEESLKLVGNVFLSAACISYLGPFTGIYREAMVSKWASSIIERGVPASDSFGLIKTMGDSIKIQGWMSQGLPTDTVSIENAIIATEATRYPLMIDPQIQANRWIKVMEKDRGLIILKFNAKDFMRTLCNSIRNGKPVLLEDVEETLESNIDPLLQKQFFQNEGGIKFIRLDGKDIDYNPSFRLYLTTKLPNPHYMPEVCIKVTLINFTVTFDGLEDQLLGDVVRQEKPDVEEKRVGIIKQLADDKKLLKESEDKILTLLKNSTLEQILDEDAVSETLTNAKRTSIEITGRMEEGKRYELQMNKARDSYKSIAVRGALLYFVIADLMLIDNMYQYSLDYIKGLFITTIEKSQKGKTQDERIAILIKNITKSLFSNISRGLFEQHKTIFSFLICCSLKRYEGIIPDLEWNYFTRGAGVFKGEALPNPLPKQIPSASWTLLLTLDRDLNDKFGGLIRDFVENKEKWIDYGGNKDIIKAELPGKWKDKFTNFEKLILIKIFRPEMILQASIEYVKKELGSFYVENVAGSIEDVFMDSKKTIPIILILSQGADPSISLLKFAEERKAKDKLFRLSLGQNQGPIAKKMIGNAQTKGDWILLENCHLAKSWMKELEQIVDSFKEAKAAHDDFRLFLTSMPADYFPSGVLQNGVKLTTEPPRGIKANLRRSYQEISQTVFTGCTKKPEAWKKLLFGLCFFHAISQERRKFGPLGFNIRYEFNDSDLETSQTMLRMFLDEQEEIPWEAMTYVTGHINYGGRVTDDWDRRCLLSILKLYYTSNIITDENYKFSQSGLYFAPKFDSLEEYRSYIEKLPHDDLPEVFGMHENASINYQSQESDAFLKNVLRIQPKIASTGSGKSADDIVQEYITDLTNRLPLVLDTLTAKKDLLVTIPGTSLLPSLCTVLLQEMERFNKLINVVGNTLDQLSKAISGQIVMSQELDDMYISVLNGQVPENWGRVAYPSLKPLFSWYVDFIKRIEFMRIWLTQGQPSSFWISGFFFPQGFMTGILQTYARSYKVPIDKLGFSFTMLKGTKDEIKEPPKDGVYIYGLFMEGARWDEKDKLLADQMPGITYSVVPPIWFKPCVDYQSPNEIYPCPIYKTSVRAGVLSTTGQSTNFILAVDLPSKKLEEYWTLRGTAMLCQLND